MTDFFISRAGEDTGAAERVDGVLRAAGYETFIQDRDFGAADFTARMDQGFAMVDQGARILALLSHAYIQKPHCLKEARYVLSDDPSNLRERLIVFRLDDVEPTGLLKGLRYVDISSCLEDPRELASKVLATVCRRGDGGLLPPDSPAPSERIRKALLMLDTADDEPIERNLNYSAIGVFVLSLCLVAFDFGLSTWNHLFGTYYFAIFDTTVVLWLCPLCLVGIAFIGLSEIRKLSASLQSFGLTVDELHLLRRIVKARSWKNRTFVHTALAMAIKGKLGA